MNVPTEHQRPPDIPWELEFARLIAFPVEPPLFLDQHWWQDLTSRPPEECATSKKKNLREERGLFQGVDLLLRVMADRVEWLIQPSAEFDGPPSGYPTIGPYRERLAWFVEFLTSWLVNSCPPLLRLAFSGKLLKPAATQQEAFSILATRLPAALLVPNPNDFFYQVNRRRISTTVPGLPLNRVSGWAKLNLTVSVPPRTPFTWPENCYSAVDLDVNTAPERADVLPRESLPALFRELASLGVEIAERGDVE